MERISEVSLNLLGYNRKQVNELVENKDQRIKELEAANQALTQRLASLEKRLDYYQSIESALKDGLLDARKTGNEIIEASEEEAQQMLAQTKEQVLQYKESFATYSRDLAQSGQKMKAEFKAMQEKVIALMQSYQDYVQQTDFESIFPNKELSRFMSQVEAYDQEDPEELTLNSHKETIVDKQLSDEEKIELQRLIQEVIQNETHSNVHTDDKLVDFQKRRKTN